MDSDASAQFHSLLHAWFAEKAIAKHKDVVLAACQFDLKSATDTIRLLKKHNKDIDVKALEAKTSKDQQYQNQKREAQKKADEQLQKTLEDSLKNKQ